MVLNHCIDCGKAFDTNIPFRDTELRYYDDKGNGPRCIVCAKKHKDAKKLL